MIIYLGVLVKNKIIYIYIYIYIYTIKLMRIDVTYSKHKVKSQICNYEIVLRIIICFYYIQPKYTLFDI